MEKKQIGIIGAGISGLLACKYQRSKGFDPIVFKARSDVGGLWIKTIASTKLQTPKTIYRFSDFPWPSSVTENFPAQHKVFDYIQSYAQHFDLIKHIRFNTKVVGIDGMVLLYSLQKLMGWINGDRLDRSDLVQLVADIRVNLLSLGHARVSFIPRASNPLADMLARSGSGGGTDLISWCVSS